MTDQGQIGWYVHDHGSGHRRRLEAVTAHLRHPVTGMGSGTPADGVAWLPLPTDATPGTAPRDPTAGGALHWAPLGEDGLLARAEALAGWVRSTGCRLLVVDVSVEMLLLGRLLGLPTVTVLQAGPRTDRAHALGYDTASALLAPWPRAAQEDVATRWDARTTWTGAFSGFDGRDPDPTWSSARCAGHRCVAVVLGRGGHSIRHADVVAAADATPGWHWHVAGEPVGAVPAGRAPHVSWHGPIPDVWALLSHAHVVVGPCGGGLVADVAAAGTPLLALPQDRPFDEQTGLAHLLRRVGCAEVAWSWPAEPEWPGLLDRLLASAGTSRQRWLSWSDGRGARRAAGAIDALVDRSPVREGRSQPGQAA